jgi:tetratricopeptide (TPR) repeat protein
MCVVPHSPSPPSVLDLPCLCLGRHVRAVHDAKYPSLHFTFLGLHPSRRPTQSDPLLSSALVSLSIDAFGDARYALELALGHNPRTVELWALAVHTELLAGSVDVARDRLAAMRSDVCSAESWLLSADLELYLGDNARAVDLLLEAVDLFPSEAALWLLLGSVWERRKQVNEAREAYGRAIASDCHEPDDESLHAALTRVGTCHGTSWLTSS